jgi:hypothetical protein
MQDALVTVLVVVVAIGVVVAIYTLLISGRSLRQIGDRGLETGAGAPAADPPGERDEEIEQMLGARNRRRELRGEQPLDPAAELAALSREVGGDGLRDEVRAVVDARNRRRVRAGLEPLDVETQIDRELRELT